MFQFQNNCGHATETSHRNLEGLLAHLAGLVAHLEQEICKTAFALAIRISFKESNDWN